MPVDLQDLNVDVMLEILNFTDVYTAVCMTRVHVDFIKVCGWRHKLQKTFLSNKKAFPKEEEMPLMNDLFTTVEGYQNLTVEHLMFTKIGKVMRYIHLLEPGQIPRDDEFKFCDRAMVLVHKWHKLLNANIKMDYVALNVNESANNALHR
ncbi:hypothetical protein B0H19DRAFT_1085035 [Mycena capillaripes]|nr:hypothetical protein B0H19DRAFT_1085035 [Mycena capillaripes]